MSEDCFCFPDLFLLFGFGGLIPWKDCLRNVLLGSFFFYSVLLEFVFCLLEALECIKTADKADPKATKQQAIYTAPKKSNTRAAAVPSVKTWSPVFLLLSRESRREIETPFRTLRSEGLAVLGDLVYHRCKLPNGSPLALSPLAWSQNLKIEHPALKFPLKQCKVPTRITKQQKDTSKTQE